MLRRNPRGQSRPPLGSPNLHPHRAQSPVHRRRAHRQKPRADLGRKLEMPMALHGLDENRRQRFQALAADPVRCLPEHDQRLANRLVIDAPLRPRRRAQRRPRTTKHTHGVFAMKAGDRDELVQNAPLLAPPALPVALNGRSHQFITRHHAHPPHRCLSDPIRGREHFR